jgi:hypothetical protein
MSFVPNAMAHSGGMIPMSPFDAVLAGINSNPYFIGIMMLLLNLGGRFISLEMSKGQEAFFYNTWVRRSLIFIIIFVGTRNVLVALIMSSIIILCIGYLFNENSSLCIFKAGIPGSTCETKKESFNSDINMVNSQISSQVSSQPVGNLTKEETQILHSLQEKLQGSVKNLDPPSVSDKAPPNSRKILDIYFNKMNTLQGSKI